MNCWVYVGVGGWVARITGRHCVVWRWGFSGVLGDRGLEAKRREEKRREKKRREEKRRGEESRAEQRDNCGSRPIIVRWILLHVTCTANYFFNIIIRYTSFWMKTLHSHEWPCDESKIN